MNRIYIRAASALVLAALLLPTTACHRHGHDEEGTHAAEPVAVTTYSEKSELFMEYDPPVAGEEAGFLIHLTRLSDFKPVTAGELKMIFTLDSGSSVEVVAPAPARPGIYKVEATLPTPGDWRLNMVTTGSGFADEIAAPVVRVAGKGNPPIPGEEQPEGEISFLKEQQWVVDFMVRPIERRNLAAGFSTPGELMPMANAEATVAAPLAGTLSVSRSLPFVGQRVAKGAVLAVIEPPMMPQGGYGELATEYGQAKSRHTLAQSEYERARQLVEAKIAPRKRLEEAEAALESAKVALAPLERGMQSLQGGGAAGVTIRSSLGGSVVEVFSGNGRGIAAGEPIVRIVDTSRLWLQGNIPAVEAGRVSGKVAATASFAVFGTEEVFTPRRLVAIGEVIDPHTRTLPILFEMDNGLGLLKVGMYGTITLHTGTVENVLAVPREALIEDEGRWFVFVQPTGESFARREVKVGIEDAGFVQLTAGLTGDERLVTRGAYYVKRAESAGKGGADHGHAH